MAVLSLTPAPGAESDGSTLRGYADFHLELRAYPRVDFGRWREFQIGRIRGCRMKKTRFVLTLSGQYAGPSPETSDPSEGWRSAGPI